MQIRNPSQKELGTYGCLVVNDFGIDTETSLLLRAGMTVASTASGMFCFVGLVWVFLIYISTHPNFSVK